ncbi:MAG: hypothetical protein ACRED4_09570, partial [Brevundimonas sp.]
MLYAVVGRRFLFKRIGLYRNHKRPVERPGAVVSNARRDSFGAPERTGIKPMNDILMPKATAVWL